MNCEIADFFGQPENGRPPVIRQLTKDTPFFEGIGLKLLLFGEGKFIGLLAQESAKGFKGDGIGIKSEPALP